MGYLVFLALLLVPLTEVALFIVVGGIVGLWPTLALAVATAFLGTFLIRQQGLSIIARAQTALAQGRPPVAELFDGLCLFIAGALLLTPGFATDAVGGLLLIPALRSWLRRLLAQRIGASSAGAAKRAHKPADDQVIDGDFEDLTGQNSDQPAPRIGDH